MPNWLSPLTSALRPILPRSGYVVTPSLIGLQVLLWVAMLAFGVHPLFPDSLALLDWGANLGSRVAEGDVWRLLSSGFLHAGAAQLALNMAVLAVLGMSLEWRMGYLRFLLAYLLCGVGAGLGSAFLSGQIVSVGAAGSMFGLLGVNIALVMLKSLPPKFKRAALVLVPLFLLANLFNFSFQGVDHWANFCGFTTGLLLAPLLRIGMQPVRQPVPASAAAPEAQIDIPPLKVPAIPDLVEGSEEEVLPELPGDALATASEEAQAGEAESADLPSEDHPAAEAPAEADPLVLPVPGEMNTFGDAPPEA